MRILVIGELNPDLILASLTSPPRPGREVIARDFALRLGSSSAICASGLAKLGEQVAFLGKAGADVFGKLCVRFLVESGVDVELVRLEPELKTGLTVSISEADRALVTHPGAMESLRAEEATDAVLGCFRHLHVSAYFLQRGLQPGLADLFRRAQALGLTTSFDPGHDPYDEWSANVREVFRFTNVLFLNEVELEEISGTADVREGLRRLATENTLVAAKLGSDGCAGLEVGGTIKRSPAIEANVLDTTGAGDSFNAGFLHGWLRGWGLLRSLRCGAVCGGLSTRGLGGCATQPDAAEMAARLVQFESGSF